MNASSIALDEEALCNLVENYSLLWDQKSTMYKDKIAKENAWQSIAAIMETSVKECQDLWEYLRAKFIRERKKIKNIPSGSASQTNSWYLYDRLGFLDRGIQTRRTKTNVTRRPVTSGISNTWEEMVLGQNGILSPTGSTKAEIRNESDEEILDETENEVMSVSDNLNIKEYTLNTPKSSDKQNATTFISSKNKEIIEKLRSEKNVKKKNEEPLERLVNTCTTIGRNINNILNQNAETDTEDYHYVMSLMESLKKIRSPAEKLKLKASFLLQLADVIENNK